MWTIYFDLIIASLTIGLAYLHKRSVELLPIRERVREEETSDNNDMKKSASCTDGSSYSPSSLLKQKHHYVSDLSNRETN